MNCIALLSSYTKYHTSVSTWTWVIVPDSFSRGSISCQWGFGFYFKNEIDLKYYSYWLSEIWYSTILLKWILLKTFPVHLTSYGGYAFFDDISFNTSQEQIKRSSTDFLTLDCVKPLKAGSGYSSEVWGGGSDLKRHPFLFSRDADRPAEWLQLFVSIFIWIA